MFFFEAQRYNLFLYIQSALSKKMFHKIQDIYNSLNNKAIKSLIFIYVSIT